MTPRVKRRVSPSASPFKFTHLDLQSRELLWELARLQVSEISETYQRLDEAESRLEQQHKSALDSAAEEHKGVREQAELLCRQIQEQAAEDNRRRQDEERNRAEAIKEAQRVRIEAAERARDEERRRAEDARRAEEERKVRERQEKEAAAQRRREKEAAEAEAAAAAARSRQEKLEEIARAAAVQKQAQAQAQTLAAKPQVQAAPLQAVAVSRAPGSQLPQERRSEHERYLQIHQSLKKFRKWMMEQKKMNTAFSRMGDMRRQIKKCIGQIPVGKGGHKKPADEVLGVLRAAAQVTDPWVDPSEFLVHVPDSQSAQDQNRFPALLLYLINTLSKAIIEQFIEESGVKPETANNIGVLFAKIFSDPVTHFRGKPIVDIFLAKLHFACPILFGFYGPEGTVEGKRALGWYREGGQFVHLQMHQQRMAGLSAGFAAISLRIFPRKDINPFPSSNFWAALANILNTPSAQLTSTHFVVLESLIGGNEQRISRIWGVYGQMMLNVSLNQLPNRANFKNAAIGGVSTIADVLERDEKKRVGMTGWEK